MVTSQCGQILNPLKQQLLLSSFFSLPKSSLTNYKLSPREEKDLRPDHVMVVTIIHRRTFQPLAGDATVSSNPLPPPHFPTPLVWWPFLPFLWLRNRIPVEEAVSQTHCCTSLEKYLQVVC